MVLALMRPPCRRSTLIPDPRTLASKSLSTQLPIQCASHTHPIRHYPRDSSFIVSLWIISLVILFSFFPTLHALPVQPSVSLSLLPASLSLLPESHILHRRRNLLIIANTTTGQATVIDPTTRTSVAQGAATDGGGVGHDAPALIWVSFSLVLGLPMAFAGIRGWRLTTGVGVGLAGTVASWAAFINSISAAPLSDLTLTLIILGFFSLLFVFGVFPYGRIAGIACIGLVGGTAFGVRVVILKAGLLIPGSMGYAANWVLVGFCGLAGGISILWERSQRGGLVFGCASIGTFLSFLGVDLLIHQQAGMSRGLRFLFDRNSSHFLDIVGGGYTPSTLTQVLIGVSLFLTPILAFGQHYFFKQPFSRNDLDEDVILSDDANPPNEHQTPKPGRPSAAMKVNVFNMGQKDQRPVSTRVTKGSAFGFANTNNLGVNPHNGVGVGAQGPRTIWPTELRIPVSGIRSNASERPLHAAAR